jgi:CSLREA domain-containing protein
MGRAKKVATAAGGLFAAAAVLAPAANAETFVVNSTADPGDGTCDASECTLREAIDEANFNGTPDTITFAPTVQGTIQLAHVGGVGGDALEVTNESLDIVGPGADKLTIEGQSGSRIFKLLGFATPDEEVTISGLTLSGGSPTSGPYGECAFDSADGGAILSTNYQECFSTGYAAALTVSKLVVSDNEASAGGGIAVEQRQAREKAASATGSASLTVHQSTISGNEADYDGGGIAMYPFSGELAVDNSTIANNNADSGVGGGVAVISAFDVRKAVVVRGLEIDNSTVTGNDATGQGDDSSGSGGGISTDANLTLSSDIVYGNTVTPAPVTSKASSPSDLHTTDAATITAGYSMFGTTSGATLTESPAGTNQTGVDPQLGALQNNGGATPTELPADTSPAIDAGTSNSYSNEQRDTARTIDRSPNNASDGTDVGAVELPAEPQPEPEPQPQPQPLPGPATQLCLGKQVILTKGTDADETLTGTGVDDGILGSGGVDTIEGLSGDDCLFGQVGNDLVEGGPGNDNANGDRDNDVVNGDDGDDSVRGQNGNDKVSGGAGNDPKVTGGAGDDKVRGGPGDDFVKGDGGNDVLNLGPGEDFAHSGGGADKIFAADGDKDKIICGTGKDVAHVDPKDEVDKDCNTVDVVH